jgi:hypothetical protein
MPDLRQTRQSLKIGFAILALIDIAAGIVLFSPLVGSERSRREQLDQMWRELQQKTREVEPLRGLDKKIPVAQHQIDDFCKNRLPAQDSAISSDLGKLAQETSVKINGVKYNQKDTETAGARYSQKNLTAMGLQRVQIDAELEGNYLQLMRFINELERNQLFFLVDSVQLGDQQGETVKLQMKLETYLRIGTA